ncbi:GIY-YIG nuclease family protein [Candidatus Gracilibacteria bacterium]|nr:GIY-YIG nuclease family protein [Candidatus Gracilibacteria bacterium]
MYIVYILKSEEGKFYVGQTSNLDIRLRQHNEGLKGHTKKYTNWKIVHSEQYSTRTEALERERQIKKLKFGETFRKHFDTGEANNAG